MLLMFFLTFISFVVFLVVYIVRSNIHVKHVCPMPKLVKVMPLIKKAE